MNATDLDSLFEQVKTLYKIDQENPQIAKNYGDLPTTYEGITREWLTAVLCRNTPDAEVESFLLDVPDNGTTNRCRIHLKYTKGDAALPASVFCKASHGLPSRLVLAASDAIRLEVTFYNKLRPLLNIEAPQVCLADYDRKSFNSLVMMRYLGNGVEFCQHTTTMTLQRAESQMDLLARLHARFYQKQELDNLVPEVPTFGDYFYRMKDVWEACCTQGFLAAKEVVPARLYSRSGEVWRKTLRSVDMHAGLPRTLTHGDVHLRNWYITANGALGLTDWQCITKGHCMRDVAYALVTALDIDQRRVHERHLIAYYLKRLQSYGNAAPSLEDAWRYYTQHLFTVLAWWTYTLTPITAAGDVKAPNMQPHEATMEFIRRITTAMDDVGAFDTFS